MGNIIQGPWLNKPQFIYKVDDTFGRKIMSFSEACQAQEMAFKNGFFSSIYYINMDYSKCFLLPSTKEDVEGQIMKRMKVKEGGGINK